MSARYNLTSKQNSLNLKSKTAKCTKLNTENYFHCWWLFFQLIYNQHSLVFTLRFLSNLYPAVCLKSDNINLYFLHSTEKQEQYNHQLSNNKFSNCQQQASLLSLGQRLLSFANHFLMLFLPRRPNLGPRFLVYEAQGEILLV